MSHTKESLYPSSVELIDRLNDRFDSEGDAIFIDAAEMLGAAIEDAVALRNRLGL